MIFLVFAGITGRMGENVIECFYVGKCGCLWYISRVFTIGDTCMVTHRKLIK